jgi:hypothetical protein
VSHGEQYPAIVAPWGSQFVAGAREMSLQLAAASYIYIHYALKKRKEKKRKEKKRKEKKTPKVGANAIVHKQGSLQWFKFISRLGFSAGQWPV